MPPKKRPEPESGPGRTKPPSRFFTRRCDDYKQIVRTCTAAIDSGHLSRAGLVEVFNKRGYWSVDINPTLAIHDYTQAIRLKPNDAGQFHYCGHAGTK